MPKGNHHGAPGIAIETSGRIGSIALSKGPELIETAIFSAELRHAVELLPAIDSICRRHEIAPAELAEVYVSGGPGSFTGLRLGITVARTLVWAGRGRVRAVRVPTLDVIAQNCLQASPPPSNLVVLLDAKRQRVYAAAFVLDGPGYRRITEPAEWDPEELAATLPAGCAAVGEGIAYHQPAVERAGLTILPEELNRPRAEVVQALGSARSAAGEYDDLASLVPIYVRRPEAEEVWERRHQGAEPGPSGA